VIASIAFRKFKALRHTHVALTPFNLVIGPNGSGKTSLIEAVLRLRTLAALPPSEVPLAQRAEGPEIAFRFEPPYAGIVAQLGCESGLVCDTLRIEPRAAPGWPALRRDLSTMRGYVLEPEAMARPARRAEGAELAADGGNLAAVLAHLRVAATDAFAELSLEVRRLMPEFRALELRERTDGRVEFGLVLAEGGMLPADELSQGTLYLIAVLALAFDPEPPRVLCIEEVDRGVHPRMLREIRDALYRLSHPPAPVAGRRAVQIITTTHSPYFIDLFRDHPEEVVISQKVGRAAQFERLIDRPDLPELLREGSLGDMWFSGILGGTPEER
jgi:predicted ATPase